MPQKFVCTLLVCAFFQSTSAASSASELDALIQSSCIECHDADAETRLDFTALDTDFENTEAFRKWVHVLDRIRRGEIPPPTAEQPSKVARAKALAILERELKQVNRGSQQRFAAAVRSSGSVACPRVG